MTETESARVVVFSSIAQILSSDIDLITNEMPLIGGKSLLDSMKLVELCLLLEDRAADMGFEFDWTSDAAMSRSRSMFRSASALALEFVQQMEAKK